MSVSRAYRYRCETGEERWEVFEAGCAPAQIVVDGVKYDAVEARRDTNCSAACWPQTSRALAVHPSQRKEYQDFAAANGIPTQFDSGGHPVFVSKSHRKRYAELVGATDFDGGYGDPDCR